MPRESNRWQRATIGGSQRPGGELASRPGAKRRRDPSSAAVVRRQDEDKREQARHEVAGAEAEEPVGTKRGTGSPGR
jgi:hypothetical protein